MTTHAPASRRSAAEQRKLDAALTELFEHLVTFNQTLGLKVLLLDPTSPQLRFEMRTELVGHYQYGRLHDATNPRRAPQSGKHFTVHDSPLALCLCWLEL